MVSGLMVEMNLSNDLKTSVLTTLLTQPKIKQEQKTQEFLICNNVPLCLSCSLLFYEALTNNPAVTLHLSQPLAHSNSFYASLSTSSLVIMPGKAAQFVGSVAV